MAAAAPTVVPSVGTNDTTLVSAHAVQSLLRVERTDRDASLSREFLSNWDAVVNDFDAAPDSAVSAVDNSVWLTDLVPSTTMDWKPTPLWAWFWIATRPESIGFARAKSMFERVLLRTIRDAAEQLNDVRLPHGSTLISRALMRNEQVFLLLLAIPRVRFCLSPNSVSTLMHIHERSMDVESIKRAMDDVWSLTGSRHTLLSVAVNHLSPVGWAVLTDPTKPYAKKLVDDEYALVNCKKAVHRMLTLPMPEIKINDKPLNALHMMHNGSKTKKHSDEQQDERGQWLATHLPSFRWNEIFQGITPLVRGLGYEGVSGSDFWPYTVRALLERVPDVDLHVQVVVSGTTTCQTAMDILNTMPRGREFAFIYPHLAAELRAKAKTFGPTYASDAATAVAQDLFVREMFPRDIICMVLSYSSLPVPAILIKTK